MHSEAQYQRKNQLPQSLYLPQPLNDIIHKLEALSEDIETNPYQPFEQLKQYITLYVQHHSRSQQLFNLMCEHNMLAKLFTRVSKPIFVLETFNLLLANTHQMSQLVYIFSHPLFHNYLLVGFEHIVPLWTAGSNPSSGTQSSRLASHECIEYYIQLIKTLVMKLQGQINECTLLKLFCNSKYSYFPLLTNCILLAIKRNVKEQLVRVTAQHCILQLIGIMARKKVGQCYFYHLHMVIFFYEIITEMIEEQTTTSANQDTTIKYVMDLLKAISHSRSLQMKQKSFILFFNILSNCLTFRFIKNPAPALHLLLKLSTSFTQVDQLTQMPQKYLTPIYFILGKLLFNKYLNNVTLSSIILVSEAILQLSEIREVNLLKIIRTQYEKNPINIGDIEINRNSFKQHHQHSSSPQRNRSTQREEPKPKHLPIFFTSNKFKNSAIMIEDQLIYQKFFPIIKQIDKYNLNNNQFFQLKQNYYKKSSSSGGWLSNIGSLFKKINVFDMASFEYIKKLMHIASIRYVHQQPFAFLEQVFAPTAIYLYELFRVKNKEKYIFGQRTEDTQKIQISFNQNRDEFLAQNQFFKVVLNIAEVAFSQIDSMQGSRRDMIDKLQVRYNHRLANPGEVYFTLHFRQYFQHSLFEFVCTSENIKHRTELSPKLLNYLYKICSQLELSITQNSRTKVINEISKIQNELFNFIKQKGFEAVFEYMDSQKENKMVGQDEQINMLTSVFRFDSERDSIKSRQSLSSSKKKKSIFGPLRSSSSNFSPSKESNNDRLSMKQSSLPFKLIESKMLHLQLLRFILSESPSMGIFSSMLKYEAKPLYKTYEEMFVQHYRGYSNSLYELKGVTFNSEMETECVLKVKSKSEDCTVVVELYHQDKLILKCNCLDFNLSQAQAQTGSMHAVEVDQYENKKIHYFVTILPTANTLGFSEKQKVQQFIFTLEAIKQQFKSLKEKSILIYLNKEDSYEQLQHQ